MKQRKKILELPERLEQVPDGYYMIKIGDSRLIFDALGNPKPPAEVRKMIQPKRARAKQKRL